MGNTRVMARLVLVVGVGAMCLGLQAAVLFNGVDVETAAAPSARLSAKTAGGVVVVRFRSGAGPAEAGRLRDVGVHVLGYVWRDGYLVSLPRQAGPDQPKVLGDCDLVAAIRPEWKVEPALAGLDPSQVVSQVPVVVHSTGITDSLRSAIGAAGGVVTGERVRPYAGRLGVVVPPALLSGFLKSVSGRDDVYAIAGGGGAHLLNDNASAILQSGSSTGGRPIWAHGLYGEGQVVATLDTGLDFDSCYFRNADLTPPPLVQGTSIGSPDQSRRKVIVYDFLYAPDYGGGPTVFDSQGHGTLVGGNALGSHITSPFAENVRNGMAPAAKLVVQDGGYAVDNCSDLPALGCPVIDLTSILDQAVGQGANFHNNSWGDRENYMPQNTYTAPTADMDDVIWRNPEFLIVCAAGNSGPGNDTVGSPSIGKNVLSVGATQSPSISGSPEIIAGFSSRGWAADGRIKPDVTAPGQTQTSTNDGNVTTNNCGTGSAQGTSMASPVTAGCAALVRQYYGEGWYPSGTKQSNDALTASAALVKATLINGAVDMTGVTGPPPNRTEGWGRVKLEDSLYFSGDTRKVIADDRRDLYSKTTDTVYRLRFEASGTTAAGTLKITLVWTDYPAIPGATIALVNDLDLEVVDLATSTTWLGNRINTTTGLSDSGGTADTINNVEQVVLAAGTSGQFDVRVRPSVIAQPWQGFALVVSGDVQLVVIEVPVGLSRLELD